MPRSQYTNLSLKKEAARKLEQYTSKYGVSSASFIHMIIEKLDVNVPINDVLQLLENIQSIRFHSIIKSEVLKVKCAKLYFYVNAMSTIVTSLLKPSSTINLGSILIIHKLWEKKSDVLTLLRRANLVDRSITLNDIASLIQELETVKSSLKKILDNCWPNWRNEVAEPPIIKEINPPNELLEHYTNINPDVLRNELQPYINDIPKLWKETNELIHSIANHYPEILELTSKCMKNFSKLFTPPNHNHIVNKTTRAR